MDNNAVTYPKFRFIVGLAATMAWINIGWVIVGFAPLLTFIQQEFGIPLGMVMVGAMALNSVAGGTSVILCGPLVDKFGPRKVLFVSAILLVAYALLIPYFSANMTQLIVLRLLAGVVGHGPLFAGKAAMAQRWFPRKEQSVWIGIWNSGFAVGVAILYLTYFPLFRHFNSLCEDGICDIQPWRQVASCVAIPSAIFAVMMLISLFGKEPQVARHGGPAGVVQKDFALALKLPVLWAGAILLGCAQGVMQSVNGLTASYLLSAKPLGLDWNPAKAGPAMTFIQMGMILSGVLISAMLVYIFRGSFKWLTSATFLLAGLAAMFLTSAFSTASLSHMQISFIFIGYLMNIGYPTVTAFTASNYPPRILGKVFGVCGGISVYMGAALSAVAGIILDKTQSFTSVYTFIFGIGLVAAIVAAVFLSPVTIFKQNEVPAVSQKA